MAGKVKSEAWDEDINSTVFKIDSQQGPIV